MSLPKAECGCRYPLRQYGGTRWVSLFPSRRCPEAKRLMKAVEAATKALLRHGQASHRSIAHALKEAKR
jgi:hypothetical protein